MLFGFCLFVFKIQVLWFYFTKYLANDTKLGTINKIFFWCGCFNCKTDFLRVKRREVSEENERFKLMTSLKLIKYVINNVEKLIFKWFVKSEAFHSL